MSNVASHNITCPRCKHMMDVQLYDSVNVATDPALRDQLMRNQLNMVTCPQCELAFRVDKPLLYCDPAKRILIYWLPTAPDSYQAGEDQFRSWLMKMGNVLPDDIRAPDIHLVFTRIELVERIFLLEQGLNERLIEYIKYIIYSRNAGRVNPAEKALLFNAEDSNETTLCFVVQDVQTRQLESVLQYSRDAYKVLADTFSQADKTADLLELFPGPYISARTQLLRELDAEKAKPEN